MKFAARPRSRAPGIPGSQDVSDPNYLRKALRERLTAKDAQDVVFDFQVQVRGPDSFVAAKAGTKDDEIENVCVEWREADHPFETVATITVPAQDFETEERRSLCENLVFSPWHGVVEHRPLGGINRLRRAVYEASALARRP